MSETGLPQAPQGIKTQQATQAKNAERILRASLESAPQEVRDSPERVRIRGEVREVRKDGTARIQTQRGEIEVRFQNHPRTPPPARGERVEVDIPPAPPEAPPSLVREVSVRTIERFEHSAQIRAEADLITRQSATPVDVHIEPAPPTQSETRPENLPQPLQAGTEIRLQPLPPSLVAQVALPDPVENIQAKPELIRTAELGPLSLPVPRNIVAGIQTESALLNFLSNTENAKPTILQAFLIESTDAQAPHPAQPALKSLFPRPEAILVPLQNTKSSLASQLQSSSLQIPSANTALISNELPRHIAVQPARPTLVLNENLEIPTNPTENPGTLPPIQSRTFPAQVIEVNAPPPVFVTQSGFPIQTKPSFSLQPEGKTRSPAPENITTSAKAENIRAVVSGILQDRLPVITITLNQAHPDTAQERSFILHTPEPASVIVGTDVLITPQTGLDQTAASASVLPPPLLPLTLMNPGLWPVMDEIHQALQQAAPQVAQVVSNISVNIGNPAQVPAAALFFIAAIRSGDLQSWLGERAVETLRRSGKGNLLQRLTQESGLLNRMGAEPVAQDWRGIALPMAQENEIRKITLYYKHEDDNDQNQDQKNDKSSRFVMDLSLSRMGKVQLDGLFKDKKFDLIVRTQEPFSQAARVAMRSAYHQALEYEGLDGALSFQNRPNQWVHITPENEKFVRDI